MSAIIIENDTITIGGDTHSIRRIQYRVESGYLVLWNPMRQLERLPVSGIVDANGAPFTDQSIIDYLDGIINQPEDTGSGLSAAERAAIIAEAVAQASGSGPASEDGWVQYADTQYTPAAPFTVQPGAWTPIPNDGLNVIDAHGPTGVVFYDGAKITPDQSGDGVNITINFSAISSQAQTDCEFAIDIGGTIGRIFPRTFTCADSAGSVKPISFSFSGYTLGTWKANGGELQIKTEHAVSIYGVSIIIGRYSKA